MDIDILYRDYNHLTDYFAVRSIYEEGGLFYAASDSAQRLREKVRRDPGSIVVAVNERDEILGTVSIMEDGRMAYIFRLAVAEESRRQGIGEVLMSEAEGRLKARGYDEIWILVEDENELLKDYYRRQQYKEGHAYRFMTKEVG